MLQYKTLEKIKGEKTKSYKLSQNSRCQGYQVGIKNSGMRNELNKTYVKFFAVRPNIN